MECEPLTEEEKANKEQDKEKAKEDKATEEKAKEVAEHVLHHDGLSFEDCSTCKKWFDFVSVHENRGLEGKKCLICGVAFIKSIKDFTKTKEFENHMLEHAVDTRGVYSVEEIHSEMVEVTAPALSKMLNHKKTSKSETSLGSKILTETKRLYEEYKIDPKRNLENQILRIIDESTESIREVHVCHICGKVYGSRYGLNAHEKSHNEELDHKCQHCNYKFNSLRELKVHVNLHKKYHESIEFDQQTEFKCDTCCETFESRQAMQDHLTVQKVTRKPRCYRLPKQDLTKFSYKPLVEEGKHECSNCKRVFGKMTELMEHMTKPCDGDKYLCAECGKHFLFKRDFLEHLLLHGDNKKFVCATCSKRFKTPGELRQHEYTHDAVRNFECETCKKKFKRPNDLSRHLAVHVTKKTLPCDRCDKFFKSKELLRMHKRNIHEHKTYLECHICGQKLKNHGSLKLHSLKHVEEKVFGCTICGKKYRHSGGVRTHMIRSHRDLYGKAIPERPLTQANSQETKLPTDQQKEQT